MCLMCHPRLFKEIFKEIPHVPNVSPKKYQMLFKEIPHVPNVSPKAFLRNTPCA